MLIALFEMLLFIRSNDRFIWNDCTLLK